MADEKVELTHKRAELVEVLATPLAPDERVRIQGDLSVINAKIKALNTIAAAQLKAVADRRKIAGMAEAQANAARSKARAHGDTSTGLGLSLDHMEVEEKEEEDPAQARAIDDWIKTVLADSGVKTRRIRGGHLDFEDVPAKWYVVIQRLRDGIHAVARGEELPEVEIEPAIKAAPAKKTKKT